MKLGLHRREWLTLSCNFVLVISTMVAGAQSDSGERAFPQSKAAMEKALKAMQANMAGRLPIVESFAKPGEYPLDRYQRGYYQATAQVLPNASGGSIVRIKANLTAWYSDPSSLHSGYQLLLSNGRIESDLLDRLAEQLAVVTPEKTVISPAAAKAAAESPKDEQPPAPEPVRKFPDSSHPVSSPLGGWDTPPTQSGKSVDTSSKTDSSLQAEANSLEEILKNTSHPRNLVAIKKSGTPVVSTPSLSAKPQFLASMHDEFELLDFNADWVHVRISGLSRGWIWRNSVEMPESIPDTAGSSTTGSAAADLFRVVREETALFPGDWEPLRGKNVKIVSVQKADESAKNVGTPERLEYAKWVLEKTYGEIIEKKQEIHGIVLIFDSADGGMVAAPATALQQWRAGTLTDSALWHRCFFDPPETFDAAGSSASK